MKRGQLGHQLVDEANELYRGRGKALVSFAGTEWVDVRAQSRGRFSGIQKRGPVDYIGNAAAGYGFRFDLKASREPSSLPLSERFVPEHQKAELLWCLQHGVASGLLVGRFDQIRRAVVLAWFWLPAGKLFEHFDGEFWRRLKWKTIESWAEPLPTLDTTGQVPDYLDRVLEFYYADSGRQGSTTPRRPTR